MKTAILYIQTAINLQRKCLWTPDCKSTENMLIDFIWLNIQAKYLVQTILDHFKWDMALWKRYKCPPVHAANLVPNSGKTAYGADVIRHSCSVKPEQQLREEKGGLTDVAHNSWWHMKNSKRWDKSLSSKSGGRFKNAYELLNLRAVKISMLHKNCIFQCMG